MGRERALIACAGCGSGLVLNPPEHGIPGPGLTGVRVQAVGFHLSREAALESERSLCVKTQTDYTALREGVESG